MTETTESIFDQIFHPDRIPEHALHARQDVEDCFQRFMDGEPPRSPQESWYYGEFRRVEQKARGADLSKARSRGDKEAGS